MKKMTVCAIILLVGLLAGFGLLRRELRRAPLMPPDYGHDARPMNQWQGAIKPDTRTDYTAPTDPAWAKLRAEELRQKPQEGRN
jgi:hypothetical protein